MSLHNHVKYEYQNINGNLKNVLWSHTRTVVRVCDQGHKGDNESQWKREKFDHRHKKTLNRWSPKFVQVRSSGICTTVPNFIQIGLVVLLPRMRDFAPLGTVTWLLFWVLQEGY